MIGWLRGRILNEEAVGPLIVDVQGVGYELQAPVGTVGRSTDADGYAELWVHTHAREDTLELFGFSSELERRVFRTLVQVPNIGPRTALGILSAMPPPELGAAVQAKDVARLCKLPGVGKKTAERLVLELQEKLPSDGPKLNQPASRPAPVAKKDDAQLLVSALTNMGYKSAEAERAVQALGDRLGSAPMSELLREALSSLAP